MKNHIRQFFNREFTPAKAGRKVIMKDDKIVLYMHAGSGNHGCEAIVNSLCRMLPKPAILMTNRPWEDRKYSLASLCDTFVEERNLEKNVFVHAWYYAWRKAFGDPESFMRYRYRDILGKNLHRLNISIGGDNYCYDNMLDRLLLANRAFHRQGARTALLGCSIEPALLEREEIAEDMRLYDAIVARETITYEALCRVCEEGRVHFCPDPAFLLETEYAPLPEGFAEGNTVGINLSPMAVENEARPGITMENYKALIAHILDTTDMRIALIPHVVWENNDDRGPLSELYRTFGKTGRVVLLEDASAVRLKGYIGRCRMFIGARTHATIAAYSSCVPTLAVGYSVKAQGIAKDLFGTAQGYVLPVQKLSHREELIEAFAWLQGQEEAMRAHLQAVMPQYRQKAAGVKDILEELAG